MHFSGPNYPKISYFSVKLHVVFCVYSVCIICKKFGEMRFFFHWRKISVNEFVGEFNFPASLITRMATILPPSPFPLLFNTNFL